jgi:hypothetical protein
MSLKHFQRYFAVWYRGDSARHHPRWPAASFHRRHPKLDGTQDRSDGNGQFTQGK